MTRTITYTGDVVRAGMLAAMLEREGISVDWTYPRGSLRSAVLADLVEVVSGMVASGAYDSIKTQ